MALSGKFNTEALESSKSKPGFNPFAANVLLTAADAVKLAALEEGAGSGIARRVLAGGELNGARAGGRDRRNASRDDALLRAMALTTQQWDAQLVTVGGVAMTNAEAQAARRRIIENPDPYIGWAKERGLIADGEEKAFIDTGRQITELKELERGGRIKPEQKEKMEALEGSRLGRAFDEATGQAHLDKGRNLEARNDRTPRGTEDAAGAAQGDALLDRMTAQSSPAKPEAPRASSVDDPLFAGAPSLKSGFAAGVKASEPLDRTGTAPATNETPAGPDRSAAASGLDL